MAKPADLTDTRARFIAAASQLFAERGFYGASMDHIAREVGMTKQALIHHFGSKEKLYGAVLENISQRLMGELKVHEDESFASLMVQLFETTQAYAADTRLLMRELLDNRARATKSATWYLRPFLSSLHERLQREPGWGEADPGRLASHVYQLLGAINYFVISAETLDQMLPAGQRAAMKATFVDNLQNLANTAP